jgi:hypothetical protein
MNYSQLLSLNIFTAIISFAYPESFFQFSLLVVSIILSVLKVWDMYISIKLRKRELKQRQIETQAKPSEQSSR